MTTKTVRTLIKKYYQYKHGDEVGSAFRKWFLDGSYEQEKESLLRKIWEETEAVADNSTRRDLDVLHRRIKTVYSNRNKKYNLRPLLRIVAGFLLFLFGGLSTYIIQNKNLPEPVEWTECFVSDGQQKKMILSDGSTVWLNSGSVLVYAKEFKNDERLLYLNGEAIFDVAKDPERPFIVKTNYMEVEALGTVFNVEAYADSEYTIMTLQEGSVKVSPADQNSFILEPDQQIRFHNPTGTTTHDVVDASKILQWKHGHINFQRASFDYIVQTLERRFDVIINYETNHFAGRSFNMKVLPDEDIRHVLEILKEMIPGLRYKIDDRIIYIH